MSTTILKTSRRWYNYTMMVCVYVVRRGGGESVCVVRRGWGECVCGEERGWGGCVFVLLRRCKGVGWGCMCAWNTVHTWKAKRLLEGW